VIANTGFNVTVLLKCEYLKTMYFISSNCIYLASNVMCRWRGSSRFPGLCYGPVIDLPVYLYVFGLLCNY